MRRFVTVVLFFFSVLSVSVYAGIRDVPGWLRGTHWSGYYTGGGQGRTNMEIQIFNDAHFLLRFYSGYGQSRFDGFFGGYINYDPMARKIRFNPETDISWFARPADFFSWETISLEAWNIPMGTPYILPAVPNRIGGRIEGSSVFFGKFELTRVRP